MSRRKGTVPITVGSPPTVGPDQPGTDTKREPVKPTFQTILDAIPDPSPLQVVDALERGWQPCPVYRCLNPLCDGTGTVAWPERAERPSRFCSRRCRQIFDRIRTRLVDEIDKLQDILDREDVTGSDRATITRHLGQRRWALERYPASTRDEVPRKRPTRA